MHMKLLPFLLQGGALEWAHCGVRPGVTVGEESAQASAASTARANALIAL